jgi:uncharacterized protein
MSIPIWPSFEKWNRPKADQRIFFSKFMDQVTSDIVENISDLNLKKLFENCLLNTLDTTTYFKSQNTPSTYVITGDIEAMWLRDSTLQIRPYLQFAAKSAEIKLLILGLIKRQSECIQLDPYANAFYNSPKFGIHKSDLTEMKPGVHERKWELDSLCFHLDLLNSYFQLFGEPEIINKDELETIGLILKTLKDQQREFNHGAYFFDRITDNPIDTLSRNGQGPISGFTGMIHSSFRPSDDACKYPFHIPSNLFAVRVLRDLCQTLDKSGIPDFQKECLDLAKDIENGVREFGIIHDETLGTIYAYEADGLGNYSLMDDANIPNLLSLPFLEVCDNSHEIYQATRKYVLSNRNNFYYQGLHGSGIGSPHTPKNWVWPISLISEAITSDNPSEWSRILDLLIVSSVGTGLLHESFDINDPFSYTRPWFAWCNSYFGEFILDIYKKDPEFLNQYVSPPLLSK